MTRNSVTRVVTEPLGGSPLSQAVQARRLPDGIQPASPGDAGTWRHHVDAVRQTGWLTPLTPALAASGAPLERLRRANAGGVVVTTGQQAGVFGGPMYTLAKALTAVALADAIESMYGIPAAPVFWAATDDADFLEASVVHVSDADGLHELRLSVTPPAGTIMSEVPLGDTRSLLEQLRRSCGSGAHGQYLDWAHAAFSGRRTLGDAYVALLRSILEPLGMAVLDSSHPAYRDTARPVLVRALDRVLPISTALGDVAAQLRAGGFEPQVQDERGLSLVFEIINGTKRRLRIEEAGAASRGTAVLAPNVLLRPVVERAILPTVAYVAGPGELAYFAQVNAVASVLESAPAVGVARWSGTVIEPFVDRALGRLGIEWTELRNLHALERRLAQQSLPPAITAAWKQLREQTDSGVRNVSAAVRASGLMPDEVLEGLRRSLQHRLQRGERRLLAAAKRRGTDVQRDLAIASAALFPMGKRQERMLNFVPMLARGGDALRDQMLEAARAQAQRVLGADRRASVAAT